MDDQRDSFEQDLAEDLAALADTPLPGRTTPDSLSAAAAAADRGPRLRGVALAVAAVFAVVATSLVLSPDPPGTAEHSATPEPAASSPRPTIGELRYTCGGHHTFMRGLLDEQQIDLESVGAGAVLARFIENGRDYGLLPAGGWHLIGMDEHSASFVAASDGVPTGHAQLRTSGDGWRVTSWGGGCHALLAVGGQNPANWRLAPGQEITPDTTSFLADVTEQSCGGGASTDRIQPPIIGYGDDLIAIAFSIEPPPAAGIGFCIATQPSRVHVNLAEPLGDRQLVDAGSLPWKELASAPTERSADEVAEFVVARLESNRKAVPEWTGPIEIVSIEAMSLREALAALDMLASSDPPSDELGTMVWLVRANGPFVSARGGGRGNSGILTGTSGHFVIEDTTGAIIAMGLDGGG